MLMCQQITLLRHTIIKNKLTGVIIVMISTRKNVKRDENEGLQ